MSNLWGSVSRIPASPVEVRTVRVFSYTTAVLIFRARVAFHTIHTVVFFRV